MNLSECAYIIRFVELNHRNGSRPWSVRQTAVYHKHTYVSHASTWIFLALSDTARVALASYLDNVVDMSTTDPFEMHVLLLNTAMANWRPYLAHVAAEAH